LPEQSCCSIVEPVLTWGDTTLKCGLTSHMFL